MTTNDQPSNVGGGTLLQGTGWMYEGVDSEINKEEYLLGKKIGKNFEVEGTAGQINAVEYDVAPPSIFASRANHQVDLQRKLMEDPLVQIKKREVEDRKKLMDNPVKMKQLQDHLKSLEKKSKKSKKHKKEKKKKHKKGRGEDSDDENYRKIKREPESRRGEYRREPESRRGEYKREPESRRGEYKREPESRRGEYKREPESRRGDRDSKPPKKLKKRGRSSSDDSDSDDADLDMKLLKKLQAMEKGTGGGSGSDSDEYESDDEAEERKKQALLAAGIDPNNIEAPMFSNTARKLGPENAPEKGKGDWDCLKCGNWNFVRRVECFKCNTKKGEGKAPAPAPMFVPIAITRIAKADPTPVLKKSRVTAQQQQQADGKVEAGGDSPPGRAEDGRPGDWRCKKAGCGYSNFASRSSCNKCSTAKGDSGVEAPARAAYQRKEGRGTSPSPPRRRETGPGSPSRRGGLQAPAGRSAYRREPSRSPPPAHRRRSPDRKRSPPPVRKDETPTAAPSTKKLSDAEKQAKLAQMMANAEWRDEQRTSRVKKQRASQEREDADARREHDPGFLSRELKRAQEAQTMEGRIGANKHNIQRGHGDMDKNFARR